MAKFATITVQSLDEINKFATEAAFSGITTALATMVQFQQPLVLCLI